MYTKNAVGPNTEPCGTPLPTLSLELSQNSHLPGFR